MTTPSKEEIERQIKNSFLARVPAIMAASPEMSLKDAIQRAHREESKLLEEMLLASQGYKTERGSLAIETLSARIYQSIRQSNKTK